MRKTPLLLCVLVFGACDCGDDDDVTTDPTEDMDVGGDDLGPVCVGRGGACTTEDDCCEGPCESDVCSMGSCAADTVACTADADCCSMNCDGSTCAPAVPMCAPNGDTCAGDGDCCSENCDGTTCAPATGCGMTGATCTAAADCCSANCVDAAGTSCAGGACNCAPAPACTAAGQACTDDFQCCNGLCDRPGGAADGTCASPGSCMTAGEPCGTEGLNGSCCSTVCLDTDGSGPRCQFLGGCRVQDELCGSDGECCSGACEMNGTTADGRPIMRCGNVDSCLPAGEVCGEGGASSNCCPNGGGDTGCEPTGAGFRRCLGGDGSCTLPTFEWTTTEECCKDAFPTIECQDNVTGEMVCCLSDGEECAFGDVCCSGICTPDPSDGVLRCGDMCIPDGGACTTASDCCGCGCVDDGAGGRACTSDVTQCENCTGPQLGERCSADGEPCCNGPTVVCNTTSEFPTCVLAR